MKPDSILFGIYVRASLWLLLFGFLSGCTQEHPGEIVYQKQCSQCHGLSGQGLKKLYPPLDKSPYLSQRLNDLPCLIVYGSRGSGKTAKTSRSRFMPPIKSIRGSELLALLDFLQKRWSSTGTIVINQSELEEWLASCKT